MCTLPRNTVCAMAPPIIAAAMLSRKLDSTNTSTSSTKPPFQSSGRKCGRAAGTWLFSNGSPAGRSRAAGSSRLARITHSCCRCRPSPASPAPVVEAARSHLVERDGREPAQGDREGCGWWNSATPARTSAKSTNSTGTARFCRPIGPDAAGETKGRGRADTKTRSDGLPLESSSSRDGVTLMLRSGLRRGGKSNSVEHGGGRTRTRRR